ncbi:MAG TPA: RNA polymerase sigma factor [Candidatus Limnocylindrales bacterium]|nr:RNA polymerase sigma factor [Candidatus Limnocylindrales bacterium]
MDRRLVELAQGGDRDAFAGLVHAVGDRLYALAFRILRDPHLAQDAYQETLLTAWRQLPNLRDPDRFDAWTRQILVHACYAESRRRTQWRTNVRVLELEESAFADAGHSVHDREQLEEAFATLSIDQRAVFALHHYLGVPLVEIASTLGIPAGTARSRLHYATQAMRAAIEAADAGGTARERTA